MNRIDAGEQKVISPDGIFFLSLFYSEGGLPCPGPKKLLLG